MPAWAVWRGNADDSIATDGPAPAPAVEGRNMPTTVPAMVTMPAIMTVPAVMTIPAMVTVPAVVAMPATTGMG